MKRKSESAQRLAELRNQLAAPSTSSARPDFDTWAAAVRQQMLAVLEKRRQA